MSDIFPFLFVTGMPRSGTSLLDKLLTSLRDDLIVYSQPLPYLFRDLKTEYLTHLNQAYDFYMSDMLFENSYCVDDFNGFLTTKKYTFEDISSLLNDMKGYSGQYTKPKISNIVREDFRNSDVVTSIRNLLQSFKSGVQCVGLKEVFCEEFIPFFLENGVETVLIVRDPRDVVSSLNSKKGEAFAGKKKPHLFNVRAWRKSVAYAMSFKDHPHFHVLRYEDLVQGPVDQLKVLEKMIFDEEPRDDFSLPEEIVDSEGRPWQSNSSHQASYSISGRSVGRYRDHLTADEIAFIEATCWYEMQYMSYETSIDRVRVSDFLRDYQGTEDLHREALRSFLWSQQRQEQELERLERIESGRYDRLFFIFRAAFAQLMKVHENSI